MPTSLSVELGAGEVTTSSLALWPWTELAERSGLGRDWALQLAELEESELRDPEVHVDQRRADRLAAVVFDHFGSGAAVAAARTVEPGHFNLVEVLARSAPTVADGLDLACQFLPLIHRGGHLEHLRERDGSVVRWKPRPEMTIHPGYVELLFTVAMLGMRRETGCAVVPRRVWFAHSAPLDLELHHAELGEGVRFGMPEDAFELALPDATLPLCRANAAAHRSATEAAREALSHQR